MSAALLKALKAVEDAVYHENAVGGEARAVVLKIARDLDVTLHDDVLAGNIWSPENMHRVVEAVRDVKVRLRAAEARLAIHEGREPR